MKKAAYAFMFIVPLNILAIIFETAHLCRIAMIEKNESYDIFHYVNEIAIVCVVVSIVVGIIAVLKKYE